MINSKTLHLLSAVIFIAIMFNGCSKEKQLERMLYKGKGTWTISNVTWQKTVQDSSGQHLETGTTTNPGSFAFDKDGSGAYEYTVDSTKYADSFSWTVKNEIVSITQVSQNISLSGNITQTAIAFNGIETEKKQMEIEGSYTKQITAGTSFSQTVLVETFTLKKD